MAMLIVYQSLESVGEKDPTGYTVISGNSFKHRAQHSVDKMYENSSNFSDRSLEIEEPTWDDSQPNPLILKKRKIEFPDENTHIKRHKGYKSEKDLNKRLIILDEFLNSVIQNIKLATVHQTAVDFPPTSRVPDLIVLGEIYGDDLLNQYGVDRIDNRNIAGYQVLGGIDPTGDARHRFTVLRHMSYKHKSDIELCDIEFFPYHGQNHMNKGENAICVMMRLKGWLTAFVHIPNNICKIPQSSINYIRNNVARVKQKLHNEGHDVSDIGLDLLIGDTNQDTNIRVEEYMSGYDNNNWHTSITDGTQEVVGFGGFNHFKIKGTNSVFNRHFDIACSHHATVKIKNGMVVGGAPPRVDYEPAFIFHGLTDKFFELTSHPHNAYAYSDHNGIIVEILCDKKEHALYKRKMINQRRINAFKKARPKPLVSKL